MFYELGNLITKSKWPNRTEIIGFENRWMKPYLSKFFHDQSLQANVWNLLTDLSVNACILVIFSQYRVIVSSLPNGEASFWEFLCSLPTRRPFYDPERPNQWTINYIPGNNYSVHFFPYRGNTFSKWWFLSCPVRGISPIETGYKGSINKRISDISLSLERTDVQQRNVKFVC